MSKRVLIIDDDPATVQFLSVALQDEGYETDCAFDGKEGLQKIKDHKPDLVVLDVMMPKKTGFTLFKQLRKDEQFKDLPVLMLTAVAEVLAEFDAESEADTNLRPFDSLREVFRKGIKEMRDEGLVKPDMFVDKPVDPEAFVERVRELIGS